MRTKLQKNNATWSRHFMLPYRYLSPSPIYKKGSSGYFSAVSNTLSQSSLTGYKAGIPTEVQAFSEELQHFPHSLWEDIQMALGRPKFPLQVQQHWWNHSIMTTGWWLKKSSSEPAHSSSGSAETVSFPSKNHRLFLQTLEHSWCLGPLKRRS